jgi:hypothetical protein
LIARGKGKYIAASSMKKSIIDCARQIKQEKNNFPLPSDQHGDFTTTVFFSAFSVSVIFHL